jgi:Uma2 family endonuclease
MTTTQLQSITLESFLKESYIDDSPAWEYLDGEIKRKLMPKIHHSRLQLKLASKIESVAEKGQIALALPELRCNFGDRSIVPDIAVVYWDKIPYNDQGEVENTAISFPPDWTIEILSPKQAMTPIIDKIIHCLEYGCQLGWLIVPDDRSVLVFKPNHTPKVYQINSLENLPVLDKIAINLTAADIFAWLKMK